MESKRGGNSNGSHSHSQLTSANGTVTTIPSVIQQGIPIIPLQPGQTVPQLAGPPLAQAAAVPGMAPSQSIQSIPQPVSYSTMAPPMSTGLPTSQRMHHRSSSVDSTALTPSSTDSSSGQALPLTNNATMVFLAHIAGKIAHADDRDHIDAKEKVAQLEASMGDSSQSPTSRRDSSSSRIASTDSISELNKESFGHPTDLFPTIRENRYEIPQVRSTLSIRPVPTAKLSDIDYIGPDGILAEDEARRLIKIFFATMHPFYPYIPKELQDPDILPGYPLLLCAILTVSTRYHRLTDNDTASHLKAHEQLWIYSQRLFSTTVWGESSSRSVGTVLSLLLFTEWNPRAIHFRWNDYANMPEDETNNEEFAGMSAMKRSEFMSFMLIGTATRLNFLLQEHPLTFLATHISETHVAIGLNKQSMLSQTLTEVDINDAKWSFSNSQKATLELLQFFSLCYEALYGQHPKFSHLDKYQNLAILDILSPILQTWYEKYHRLLKPSNTHSINFAQQASRNLEDIDWLQLPRKTIKDIASHVERESLILDYYYTKLYLYSLALSGDTSVASNVAKSKKGRNLRLDELVRYSRYTELAYKAAKEVLAVAQRVHRLKLLKFMPVRWVTRVIKAVSFIVKCYLTLTTGSLEEKQAAEQSTILHLSVIPVEEIVTLLQKTAICLRDAAPDELHLATRYSTILMYLCSQFKSKMKDKERIVADYESEIKQAEEREDQQRQQNAKAKAEAQAEAEAEAEAEAVAASNYDQLMKMKPQDADAEQQLFDDFSTTNPSETLFTWFAGHNSPGLDFVDQFTKEMEMEFMNKGGETIGKPNDDATI